MNIPSVLVVDDEPDNFDVIDVLLPNRGYALHYVNNGPEAIASLDVLQPDLILLDVMMPGMDGIEVCRRIKASSRWKAVPIIMTTALNTQEDLARCFQAGADDFLSKPINGLELRARVHSMLRLKQQYDRIQSFAKLQQNTIHLLRNNLKELRGSLSLNLSHELNSPINGIVGSIRLLIENIDDMKPESIRELLDLSYESAYRLENLTQRFLNYLYLELATSLSPDDPERTKHIDEGSTSSLIIEHLAQTLAQRGDRVADLSCQLEKAELAIPQKQVEWIITELVDNALKFSQPNTPITLQGEAQDTMFHLRICDQGRGMTYEQIGSIGALMQFERQVYQQPGIGLGLKIAQRTVELYGGRLLISSIYHQETTVQVMLPLVKPRSL